jgi:hypothetical protein
MLIASTSVDALTYKTTCTGAAVVPPVSSKATGSVSLTLINQTYAFGYFYATNIKQMTMAHLHAGAARSNGPVIAWAFNGTYGPISGSIKATFTFNPSVNNISSLLAAWSTSISTRLPILLVSSGGSSFPPQPLF